MRTLRKSADIPGTKGGTGTKGGREITATGGQLIPLATERTLRRRPQKQLIPLSARRTAAGLVCAERDVRGINRAIRAGRVGSPVRKKGVMPLSVDRNNFDHLSTRRIRARARAILSPGGCLSSSCPPPRVCVTVCSPFISTFRRNWPATNW